MVTTICWSTPGRVDYALEGIIVTCGATIAWLRDNLELFAHSRDTQAMARAVTDSQGVFLIPAFSGLGAPHWRMDLKAALTGHLVLSTLHTNDAPATISRLLNMGVEPFLITASVNLVLAQRLARRVCPDCKRELKMDRDALVDLGFSEEQLANTSIFKGEGCGTCNNTGYKGRVALYEVMRFGEALKEMVLQGASTAELKAAAIKGGMSTLRMSGIRKVIEGVTTPEEVLRVTMSD